MINKKLFTNVTYNGITCRNCGKVIKVINNQIILTQIDDDAFYYAYCSNNCLISFLI